MKSPFIARHTLNRSWMVNLRLEKPLSAQEHRVISLAADGVMDGDIANQMGITLGTVRIYHRRLNKKLSATGKRHAISIAREKRIVKAATFNELLKLSPQEERIFLLELEGLADQNIAQAMKIGITTIGTHVKRATAKNNLARSQLIAALINELATPLPLQPQRVRTLSL